MMYTTYFARLRSLPADIVPISIAGKAPDWYHGLEYKRLAPKYGFFQKWKETHDNQYYIDCFNAQVLAPINPQSVYQELTKLAQTDNFALVCYEKPTDFCHRHIVADWLREAGYQIEEWQPK